MQYWKSGNVASAINALNMMNDLSVTMDVINSTFAKGFKVQMLNMENVAQLIPHCMKLTNSKYETHILAGLKATLNILNFHKNALI